MLAQSISVTFTKEGTRGQSVHGATLDVPTLDEVAQRFNIDEDNLRQHNPELVADLEKRSATRIKVICDLSPFIIRIPSTDENKLYLNSSDATSHTTLQNAESNRAQNLKRRFNGKAPGTWINRTLQKTAKPLMSGYRRFSRRLPKSKGAISIATRQGYATNSFRGITSPPEATISLLSVTNPESPFKYAS